MNLATLVTPTTISVMQKHLQLKPNKYIEKKWQNNHKIDKNLLMHAGNQAEKLKQELKIPQQYRD